MGAGEICLTAHHEGGFCLWDTKYSNYSVMHSPYGKDVVEQFVASCKKYNVKPCYYMGPNANGWLANNQSYSADKFVEAQLGMLRELLTNYGKDYVSRLWWDHYPGGCGGLAPCPPGSFPAAWPRFVELVRQVSPSTIICPGPDCDGHQGESGVGKYPTWYPCTPQKDTNGTVLKCSGHEASSTLKGFHPYEACATMHNGWFCKGTCDGGKNTFWSAKDIWTHYMSSVGIGWVNTLNAPPGTTGQIPSTLVTHMTKFGAALRTLLKPVTTSAVVKNKEVQCGTNGTALEIDLGTAVAFNAIMTREDLTKGQRITSYGLDFYDDTSGNWKMFPQFPGTAIPPVASQHCGTVLNNVNLVYAAPPSTHMIGKVANAAACQEKCAADPKCNFWTWHDQTQKGYELDCYVRYDDCFDNHQESGHFSGICNHSLPTTSSCGGVPVYGVGVHGASIGSRMIDFLPSTTASKIRFHCKSAVGGGSAYIKSLSIHKGDPPADD